MNTRPVWGFYLEVEVRVESDSVVPLAALDHVPYFRIRYRRAAEGLNHLALFYGLSCKQPKAVDPGWSHHNAVVQARPRGDRQLPHRWARTMGMAPSDGAKIAV